MNKAKRKELFTDEVKYIFKKLLVKYKNGLHSVTSGKVTNKNDLENSLMHGLCHSAKMICQSNLLYITFERLLNESIGYIYEVPLKCWDIQEVKKSLEFRIKYMEECLKEDTFIDHTKLKL